MRLLLSTILGADRLPAAPFVIFSIPARTRIVNPDTGGFCLLNAVLELCRLERILHQHGNGHRAGAARDRRHIGGLLHHLGSNIAADLALGVAVDADIDNDRALLDHIGRDEARFADSGDQNIRAAADLCEILCAAVADGDRAVTVQQQHTHRLADDVRAADDHAFLALGIDAVLVEQLHHARRRTRYEIEVADHDLTG